MTCSIDGCEKPLRARTWCSTHWKRWRVHGDPNVCTTNIGVPLVDRFWMKVEKGPGCWNWTGSLTTSGYGALLERKSKAHAAHRFAYELLVGPIPEGMQIDHRCSNRRCVNPSHLRLATHKQNMENLTGARRNSKTGVRGVHFRRGKYIGTVGHNGRINYAGRFDTIEEAAEAVRQLRLSLFTHNDVDRKSA